MASILLAPATGGQSVLIPMAAAAFGNLFGGEVNELLDLEPETPLVSMEKAKRLRKELTTPPLRVTVS